MNGLSTSESGMKLVKVKLDRRGEDPRFTGVIPSANIAFVHLILD
jgi:hypothetical protein